MREIDPGMERKIVKQIYGKHMRPKLFSYYDEGSDEIIDLAHMLEPIHNKTGHRDFEPGEEIIQEEELCRGIYVIEKGCCEVLHNGDVIPHKLRGGDCFGEVATMGFGHGPQKRLNSRTVRAEKWPSQSVHSNGDKLHREKVQLKFLSMENLKRLFAKHPDMEAMLRTQVGLMRSRELHTARIRRLKREPDPFPTNRQASDKLFDDLYSNPENRGKKDDSRNNTLQYEAVLVSLNKWAQDLPISPDLPHLVRCDAASCRGNWIWPRELFLHWQPE